MSQQDHPRRIRRNKQPDRVAVVQSWKSSGLSQAEFCRREGITQSQLSEWKRRVTKPKLEDEPIIDEQKCSGDPTFVALKTMEDGRRSSSNGAKPRAGAPTSCQSSVVAEVRFSQASVCIFAGADVETLRVLLTAVRESWS